MKMQFRKKLDWIYIYNEKLKRDGKIRKPSENGNE